ncbi:hypothetical protein P170DRAFT_474135 [Aspergillus steynii IBT 23096]|uniref:DRBM domain-containing protein n=1 Tax=Aspergillus steynii IBT 23096 TaxID=1392250 RepID=A0A2I2GCG2_9EURO|nr:uncharacterized protein P170DRAFT_474135 [Aspergillus steynii IBT 23096]PLB50573.1 hypothetical protein P170DRAFT_474135 [Aspergillus steynii IBT 23096]
MSAAASPQGGSTRVSWQTQLHEHCRRAKISPPVFNIVSERRGGRTAWSSSVSIQGQNTIAARYWYDGQYINNAKEDAAEVALKHLNQTPSQPATTFPGQLFPYQQMTTPYTRR